MSMADPTDEFWTADRVNAFNAMDLPAQRHSPTSVAAASAAKPNAQSKEDLTKQLFLRAGDDGLTDEELDARSGLDTTLRPRRVGLCKGPTPFLVDSKRTRKTKHGNKAAVWVRVLR